MRYKLFVAIYLCIPCVWFPAALGELDSSYILIIGRRLFGSLYLRGRTCTHRCIWLHLHKRKKHLYSVDQAAVSEAAHKHLSIHTDSLCFKQLKRYRKSSGLYPDRSCHSCWDGFEANKHIESGCNTQNHVLGNL